MDLKFFFPVNFTVLPRDQEIIMERSSYNTKKIQRVLNVLSNVAYDVERVANARLAACLLYKNEFVSIGTNKFKSHPFQAKYSKNKEAIYLHAETDAIKNALRVLNTDQLSKCTLFVCRVKQDGSFGLAKPCEGCTRAIATFNIRKAFYTTGERDIIRCL
jgi:deoxycytidylate deaminase